VGGATLLEASHVVRRRGDLLMTPASWSIASNVVWSPEDDRRPGWPQRRSSDLGPVWGLANWETCHDIARMAGRPGQLDTDECQARYRAATRVPSPLMKQGESRMRLAQVPQLSDGSSRWSITRLGIITFSEFSFSPNCS